ncbi:MAG: outer membrane protein assembly factor BamD, partial [Deltaproteobacteria bacterium]|nr:outer membrane protein assembly factor BamD [Deltaproteobacteria bacterium]
MLKPLLVRGAALALICLALGACSHSKPQIKPVDELLAQGEQAWQRKKWGQAAQHYGQVRDYYPYHTQATLAQFRAAEALYNDEEYVQALAAFENFQELHPLDQRLPLVLLRIGQCHFHLSASIDRDQTETEEAVKAFKQVQKRFSKSPQAEEAEKLLRLAYIKLVRHELYVARFYRKTKAYQASIGRYEKALSYPEVGFGPRIEAELAQVK